MRIILYARAVARLSAATGIYPRFSLALHGLLNDSNLMHSEAPTNLIATYTKPHRLFFRMKGPFSVSREPLQQLYRSSFQRSSPTRPEIRRNRSTPSVTVMLGLLFSVSMMMMHIFRAGSNTPLVYDLQ